MSYKLRICDKDRIISVVTESTFKVRRENIKKDQFKLADEVYDFLYGKLKKHIYQIPIQMFHTTSRFAITTGVNERGFCTPSIYLAFDHDEYRPITDSSVNLKDLSVPLQNKIKAYKLKLDKYESDYEKIVAEVKSVVYGVTTLNKLIEIWPESEKHIKDMGLENNATKFFLKVNTDDLNKHISDASKIGE